MPRRILLVLLILLSTEVPALEKILSFHSDIRVMDSGAMIVAETIRVRAEGRKIRRGIYRDFPVVYRHPLGLRERRGFQVLEVQRDGQPEAWHMGDSAEANRTHERVYIGHKDRQLKPGEYTYRLVYRTDWQIGFHENHDELYWNVAGHGWAFPIDEISATVLLPDSVPTAGIRMEAYSGSHGAQGQDYAATVDASGSPVFRTTRRLGPGEDLTIVVTWPKGHVLEPGADARRQRLLRDNGDFVGVAVGLAVLLAWFLIAWHRAGRDPQAGAVMPRYRPEPGYSPAAMRFISRMGYDKKAFACALVNMAVNGQISIEEDGSGDYVVTRLPAAGGNLAAGEKAVLDSLLLTRDRIVLERSNSSIIQAALKAHEASLRRDYEKKYFVTNLGLTATGGVVLVAGLALTLYLSPNAFIPVALFMFVWLTIWTGAVAALWITAWNELRHFGRSFTRSVSAVAAVVFAIPFTAGEVIGLGMLYMACGPAIVAHFIGGAIIILCFYHWMKAPTLRGRRLLDKVDGFREYLGLAEADEMRLRNPPEKTPELFEQFLPYAMALDVEEVWGERFAAIFALPDHSAYRPTWYRGGSFSGSGFASALGSSLSSAVSSSSTSRSGSGGGGFSGGGGGGGGGGGW